MGFDKNAFLKNMRDSQSSDFKDVKSGTYVVTLERANFKQNTSGSEQISFGWQIDSDDDKYPNQYIWQNITVTNKNGEPNDIGQQQVGQLLNRLAEGQFDPEVFLDDPDKGLAEFLGTQVKLKVKYTPAEQTKTGYANYRFNVLNVLECVYNAPSSNGQQKEIPMTEEVVEDELAADERELGVGDYVIFSTSGGNMTGKVKSYAGDKNEGMLVIRKQEKEGEKEMLVDVTDIIALADGVFTSDHAGSVVLEEDLPKVQNLNEHGRKRLEAYLKAKQAEQSVPSSDAPQNDEDELLEDNDEEIVPELTKGQRVTFPYGEGTKQGEVHSINEDEGIVTIAFVKDGKKVGRKVPINDVVPF